LEEAVLSCFKVQLVYTGGETEVDHQNPSRHLEGDLSSKTLRTVLLYRPDRYKLWRTKWLRDTFF